MDIRSCSRCSTLVDIESAPIHPTRARFGNTKQDNTRCPICDTIVATVLRDEDAVNVYRLDATKLLSGDAKALSRGQRRLIDLQGTVKVAKPSRSKPPVDVAALPNLPPDE